MKAKKQSPYVTRIIKKEKINGTNVFLRAFCEREKKTLCGDVISPERVIYYKISARSFGGGTAKTLDTAEWYFENMKDIVSRQQKLEF